MCRQIFLIKYHQEVLSKFYSPLDLGSPSLFWDPVPSLLKQDIRWWQSYQGAAAFTFPCNKKPWAQEGNGSGEATCLPFVQGTVLIMGGRARRKRTGHAGRRETGPTFIFVWKKHLVDILNKRMVEV